MGWRLWVAIGMVVILGVIAIGYYSKANKGKDKFHANRVTGKSMLDDFDQERKDIDNLVK